MMEFDRKIKDSRKHYDVIISKNNVSEYGEIYGQLWAGVPTTNLTEYSGSSTNPELRVSERATKGTYTLFDNSYLLLYQLFNDIRVLRKKMEVLLHKINVFPVALAVLNSDKWKLIKPIIVNVEQREDEFITCLYEVDLYGYGESIPEALEDLQLALVNQLEFLLKEEKDGIKLGPMPNKQLSILRKIIMTSKERLIADR